MFEVAKTGAPTANQIVTTTGNVDFCFTVGDAPLDRLVVSCDGPRQDVYERYRIGGNLETVIKFMRDCKNRGNPAVYLEWKYIVFEYSDSDEDLILAQKIADDIGVNSLLFILTNSKWHSRRYGIDNIREFPLRSPVARVSPSAAMSVPACENSHFTTPGSGTMGNGCIDVCSVSVGKMLNVEGWALDLCGRYARHVELVIDGVTLARERTYHRRADVVAVHPTVEGERCGFIFRLPAATEALPRSVEVRVVGESETAVLGGGTNWVIKKTLIKTRGDLPEMNLALRA